MGPLSAPGPHPGNGGRAGTAEPGGHRADRDAGVTNEVLDTAAGKLAALALDLEGERGTYDRRWNELAEVSRNLAASRVPITLEEADPGGVGGLANCVARANGLLDQAAKDLRALAILVGDIRATPVANRTPGVSDGTDRSRASLDLLAMLFGSVRDNQLSGRQFEDTVLRELGPVEPGMPVEPVEPFFPIEPIIP